VKGQLTLSTSTITQNLPEVILPVGFKEVLAQMKTQLLHLKSKISIKTTKPLSFKHNQ